MSNTFITSSMVAREMLVALENSLIAANLVYRSVEGDFKKVGDTVNVRVPATFVADQFNASISNQNITESSVPVVVDTLADVSIEITSKERALSFSNFVTQVINPAAYALANEIDRNLLAAAVAGASLSASASSTAVLTDIGNVAKQLDKKNVLQQDRYFLMNPEHKYRYLALDNFSKVAYSGSEAALREADLGKVYGLQTFMAQNAPDTTAATAGTATSYTVAGTIGTKVVALGSLSAATATIKAGDGFVVDNHLYRFTEDGTGTSSAIAEIDIDRKLHKTITTSDTIYVVRDTNSVAFHKSGIALVVVPQEVPEGGVVGSYAVSPSGIAVRVVSGYDLTYKKEIMSIDVLYGIKVLDGNRICRLTDA